jgi:predicted phage-related endonuclease
MIVDLYLDRAAWLAGRSDPTAIGASEAAAVLGIHPQLDAWTLYDRKVNGVSAASTSAVLGRGQRWESVVLAEYADASGSRVQEPGAYFGKAGYIVTVANDAFPWLRSSPDAFAWQDGVLGHVEAKTAMHREGWSPDGGIVIDRWADEAAALVPPHYAIQAYVQLAVTDMPWNDICALVPFGGWLAVRWVRVMRDAETQGQIVEALSEWRDRHLVAKEPPSIDGTESCNRWLARKFERRAERPASVEERAMIERVASLRAEGKKISEEVKNIANALVSACEGSRLTFGGKGSPYGQPQYTKGRTTVDAKVLAEKFPEAHAACLKVGAPSVSFKTYGFKGDDDE